MLHHHKRSSVPVLIIKKCERAHKLQCMFSSTKKDKEIKEKGVLEVLLKKHSRTNSLPRIPQLSSPPLSQIQNFPSFAQSVNPPAHQTLGARDIKKGQKKKRRI